MQTKSVLIVIAILLVLGAALRLTTLRYNALFEPDTYVYASVANQTLHNNFQLTSGLSGVPPNPYPEGLPLVYLPAILSYLSGQSVYAVIEWLAPFFSLLGIPLAYLLAYELSKNRYAGILAAFIYAAMPAAFSRGMAGMWRGEVVVPILFGFSFLLLIRWYASRRTLNAVGAALLFFGALVWWNGGKYVLASLLILGSSYIAFVLAKRWKPSLDPNKIAYAAGIGLLLLAAPFAYQYYNAAINLGGNLNVGATITEQMPPSAVSLVYYYNWVFFLAIAGVIIGAYYGRSQDFDMAQYAMFSMFVPTFALQLIAVRWSALFALPAAVYGAYGIYALMKMLKPSRTVVLSAVLFCIITLSGFGAIFSWNTSPYDVTPGVLAASSWIGSNTPTNSLVMTLWPDGSVVESIGHRESYSDSIMGGTQMPGFGRFLFAKAGNYTYLNRTLDLSRPNYLLVRSYWRQESVAISVEAGLGFNTSINGTNLQQLINGDAPFRKAYIGNDINGTIVIYNLSRAQD